MLRHCVTILSIHENMTVLQIFFDILMFPLSFLDMSHIYGPVASHTTRDISIAFKIINFAWLFIIVFNDVVRIKDE